MYMAGWWSDVGTEQTRKAVVRNNAPSLQAAGVIPRARAVREEKSAGEGEGEAQLLGRELLRAVREAEEGQRAKRERCTRAKPAAELGVGRQAASAGASQSAATSKRCCVWLPR
jgi:hypothetical protein